MALKDRLIAFKSLPNLIMLLISVVLLSLIAGFFLSIFALLPPLLGNIGGGILIIISILGTLESLFHGLHLDDVWNKADKPLALTLSLILVAILAVSIGSYSSATIDPYLHRGTITLRDSLRGGPTANGWESDANCQFDANGLKINAAPQKNSGRFQQCQMLSTNYTNLVVEVNATLAKGDCAGLALDAQSNSPFYEFRFCNNGHYEFQYNPRTSNYVALIFGEAPQIFHTGTGQSNRLGIVAEHGTFTLYANHTFLASLVDTRLVSGHIGLMVAAICDQRPAGTSCQPTTGIFTDLAAWTL